MNTEIMHPLRFIHRVAYTRLHPLRFIHRVVSTGLHPKPVALLLVQNFVNEHVAFVNEHVAFFSVQNFVNEPNKIQNKSHRPNNISSPL